MILAVPAAAGALVCAFRGHWILGAALLVIALVEAYADARERADVARQVRVAEEIDRRVWGRR